MIGYKVLIINECGELISAPWRAMIMEKKIEMKWKLNKKYSLPPKEKPKPCVKGFHAYGMFNPDELTYTYFLGGEKEIAICEVEGSGKSELDWGSRVVFSSMKILRILGKVSINLPNFPLPSCDEIYRSQIDTRIEIYKIGEKHSLIGR